jgi:hypothetical protein
MIRIKFVQKRTIKSVVANHPVLDPGLHDSVRVLRGQDAKHKERFPGLMTCPQLPRYCQCMSAT